MSFRERNVPESRVPAGQLTERFAPLSHEQCAHAQQTVAIKPVHCAPVQQTVVIEPVAQTLIQRTVTIEPIRAVPIPNQDTVAIEPFWMRDPEPAPVLRANAPPVDRIETAFAPALETSRTNTEMAKPARAPLQAIQATEIQQAVPPSISVSLAEVKVTSRVRDFEPSSSLSQLSTTKPETLETVCFEPIRIPDELMPAAARAPLDRAPQNTSALVSSSNSKSRPLLSETKATLLVRLGRLSKQRPMVVWVGGAALAFVVSAGASFRFAHRKHGLSHHEMATTSPSISVVGAKANTPASAPVLTKTVAHDGQNRAAPALEINPATIAVAPVTAVKKGQLFDPALSAAVGQLIAGRYNDARKTYADLKVRTPQDPALVAVSKLIAAKLSTNCAGSTPNPSVSCPEVKP